MLALEMIKVDDNRAILQYFNESTESKILVFLQNTFIFEGSVIWRTALLKEKWAQFYKIYRHFGPKPSRPLDTSAPNHLGPSHFGPSHLGPSHLGPTDTSAPSHLGP